MQPVSVRNNNPPDILPLADFPQFGASADGRIWRIQYSKYSEKRKKIPFELAQTKITDGYLAVWLCCDGKSTIRIVHRLIAETFLPPKPTPKHQIAHCDGNRFNNAASNLRWATAQENADDKRKHGTVLSGEMVASAKLKQSDVRAIRESPESAPALSAKFGVSVHAIYRVRRMETWAHVG